MSSLPWFYRLPPSLQRHSVFNCFCLVFTSGFLRNMATKLSLHWSFLDKTYYGEMRILHLLHPLDRIPALCKYRKSSHLLFLAYSLVFFILDRECTILFSFGTSHFPKISIFPICFHFFCLLEPLANSFHIWPQFYSSVMGEEGQARACLAILPPWLNFLSMVTMVTARPQKPPELAFSLPPPSLFCLFFTSHSTSRSASGTRSEHFQLWFNSVTIVSQLLLLALSICHNGMGDNFFYYFFPQT